MNVHWFAVGRALCLTGALTCAACISEIPASADPPEVARLQKVVPFGPPQENAAPAAPGIWIGRSELAQLPVNAPGFLNLQEFASRPCRPPNLANQNESANTCVLAKALVYARTGQDAYFGEVARALEAIVKMPPYRGRALSLGRKLPTYVIAADLIDLKTRAPALDSSFRTRIKQLLTAPTTDGPATLTECHELRPNNWGNHCGAARVAVAAYLGDKEELARAAQVFKGYLGDREAYAGFRYGELSWQCDPSRPVGINPAGCTKDGYVLDGVLPDDQRRGGRFSWPPPHENYVYEAMQGAMVQAVMLHRAGYDVFQWQDRALLRVFRWLYTQGDFPARGDDVWLIPLVNYYYGTAFPWHGAVRAGKNMGWTDWTHPARTAEPPVYRDPLLNR